MKAHDNFYLLLGVSYGADAQHIRKCYRRLAKLCHPDKTGDQTDEFYKLKEAMDTLIEGKFAYDQTTFASSLVPLDFSAVVEERGDGFAVCVSWGLPVEMRETKPRFALLVRSDGFLSWNVCFEGRKKKVVIESLAPGTYELAVMLVGGPPCVLSCFVEDLEQKRVAKLMSLSGMTEMRARKALKRHGTVEAALDRLMKRGGAKKKKKKKKSTTKSVEEEVPNAAFFLANVKCSRCKVFIAVELVESHECGQ